MNLVSSVILSSLKVIFTHEIITESIGCRHNPDQDQNDNCKKDQSKLGAITIQTLGKQCGLTYR